MAEMRCDFGSHSWFGVLHSDSKRVSDTSMHFHRLPLKHLLTYKVLLFPHQQSALSTACDANYHDELRPETLQFQLSSSATQLFIPTSQSRSAVTQILFSQTNRSFPSLDNDFPYCWYSQSRVQTQEVKQTQSQQESGEQDA